MTNWRYIQEDNVSASYGLAADEFLMKDYAATDASPEPTLRLYTYRPHCALVGRFQNLEAELDLEFCAEHDIQVGRRPTGGGAIIMGPQQLGLCVTMSAEQGGILERPAQVYERFAAPLIKSFNSLGIDARFRPKNDLEVNGKKIAGLGVYYNTEGALLFHTSLIVDLDIPLMLKVLRIPREKVSDKVLARSVSGRITTVTREIRRDASVSEVRDVVRKHFENEFGINLIHQPISPEERAKVDRLSEEKYTRDDWLYQQSPQADMTGMSLRKTPAGLLRTYIGLKGDIIKSVLITGDFMEYADVISLIEARLKWSALDKENIAAIVSKVFGEVGSSSLQFNENDIVSAVWLAAERARTENRHMYRGSCYYPEAVSG